MTKVSLLGNDKRAPWQSSVRAKGELQVN